MKYPPTADPAAGTEERLEVNSLFEQPWWLDAVAPGAWGAVEVSSDDEVVARVPYVMEKRLGLRGVNMPPLTQMLGPWLASLEGKRVARLGRQKELMTELIQGLPPHDYFHQQFHYSIDDWLPFYWHGFKQTTRYTYVIEDLDDLDRVWDRFSTNTRKNIRKAQKQLVVRTDLGIERFMEVNDLTFQRQGLKTPYSKDWIRRLDAACAERGVRRMFFAQDAQGRVHAATYIAWDGDSAHGLMQGSDPALRNSQATSLLSWEAIRFASTVTKKFNFGGSMIEPIERFIRGFGGKPKPYFRVTRFSRRVKFLMAGLEMAQALLGAQKLPRRGRRA